MTFTPPFSYLASYGFRLFSNKYPAIYNKHQEIRFVVNHVPADRHLTELDQIDVWDLFCEAVERETWGKAVLDKNVIQFKEQLDAALANHRQLTQRNVELISPASIAQTAIIDIFPMGIIEPGDEAFVGLITRYSNKALWRGHLSTKRIKATDELLRLMSSLRNGMEMVKNRLDVVQATNIAYATTIIWMEAKARSKLFQKCKF